MTTPFQSAMAKLAAIKQRSNIAYSPLKTLMPGLPFLTPSEAAAIRERLVDSWRFNAVIKKAHDLRGEHIGAEVTLLVMPEQIEHVPDRWRKHVTIHLPLPEPPNE